jgi:Zn-dependent peptidase ImmA (M78 family)
LIYAPAEVKRLLTTEYIISVVDELVRKYGTRDVYELCDCLGIVIRRVDLERKLKGFFLYQSRIANIVIDINLNSVLERILIAHELGHAILHKDIAMMKGFQEMEVFDSTDNTENEANLFAAELHLEDAKVLRQLETHSFFQAAQALYVPAALLDYKFRAMCEKGLLNRTMEYRHSKFLKEDLAAYDDIDHTFD